MGRCAGSLITAFAYPTGSSSGNTTISWSLTEHEIEEVRLKNDGETIAERDGSHTPALDYQIEDDWSANLTLEAEISVRLKKTGQDRPW